MCYFKKKQALQYHNTYADLLTICLGLYKIMLNIMIDLSIFITNKFV